MEYNSVTKKKHLTYRVPLFILIVKDSISLPPPEEKQHIFPTGVCRGSGIILRWASAECLNLNIHINHISVFVWSFSTVGEKK